VGIYSREFLTELHAKAETAFEPKMEPSVRQAQAQGWAKAVRKSFGWVDGDGERV
jgi:glycerol kinase